MEPDFEISALPTKTSGEKPKRKRPPLLADLRLKPTYKSTTDTIGEESKLLQRRGRPAAIGKLSTKNTISKRKQIAYYRVKSVSTCEDESEKNVTAFLDAMNIHQVNFSMLLREGCPVQPKELPTVSEHDSSDNSSPGSGPSGGSSAKVPKHGKRGLFKADKLLR
jgi:hypothetical protein